MIRSDCMVHRYIMITFLHLVNVFSDLVYSSLKGKLESGQSIVEYCIFMKY